MEVTIRAWSEDDAAALNAAVAASREHLAPWMRWAREPAMSLAARRTWIRDQARRFAAGQDELFGIYADGRLAGSCGLHDRVGPGALEIGYWVGVGFLRRGVATAAVGALVARAAGRPSVSRLEIHHHADNVASGRVAAAAGFVHVEDRLEVEDGVERVERIWRRDTLR